MKRNLALQNVLMLGWMVCLVGCQPAGIDELEKTDPGRIEIIEAGIDTGVKGVYLRNDDVIHFEAVRGLPIENARPELGEPAYEIDVRIMDADGYVFMSQAGGDGFIDPTWEVDAQKDTWSESADAADLEQRSKAFDLAIGMTKKIVELSNNVQTDSPNGLSYYQVEADFTSEIEAIAGLVTGYLSMDKDVRSGSDVSGLDNWGGAYTHIVQAHKKDSTGGAYEHSGTRSYCKVTSTGAQVGYYQRCNHGTCPGGTGMRCYCKGTWSNRTNDLKGNTNCSTYYNPLSTMGGHNCHDDTYLQFTNVRRDTRQSTSGGRCSSWATNINAWSCSTLGGGSCSSGGQTDPNCTNGYCCAWLNGKCLECVSNASICNL